METARFDQDSLIRVLEGAKEVDIRNLGSLDAFEETNFNTRTSGKFIYTETEDGFELKLNGDVEATTEEISELAMVIVCDLAPQNPDIQVFTRK